MKSRTSPLCNSTNNDYEKWSEVYLKKYCNLKKCSCLGNNLVIQSSLKSSETCDGCKENACDHINGVCSDTSGCKQGFLFGIYCNKTCEDWHFGRNCSKTCNCRNQPCKKSSGKCSTEGCQRGWHGDSCDEDQGTNEYINVGCVTDENDVTVSVLERASRMSDAFPTEDDVEDEGNVYNNVPSKKTIVEYTIAIGDLKHVIEEKQKNESFKEEYERKCEQYWPQEINRPMVVDQYKLTMKEETIYTIYVYRLLVLQNKKEQYKAVFEALLELFTVPETAIQKNNFCISIEKQENRTLQKNQMMYKEEFQRLQSMRPFYSAKMYTAAVSKEHTSKNYQKNVLAHDQYRPYLISYGIYRNDYINAVIIPGFSADSKFFVTQYPLMETVVDFWTIIYDHRSDIIVLLDPVNEGYAVDSKMFVTQCPLVETVIDFWTMMYDHSLELLFCWIPETRTIRFFSSGSSIMARKKKEMLQFDDFRIIKETENAHEEFQLTLNHTKNKEQISINVFTADDWTISNAPPSPEYMLDLLQRVQNCLETQKVPITVVCRGSTKIIRRSPSAKQGNTKVGATWVKRRFRAYNVEIKTSP
ncbi:PTPRK [Mytilus coruscus]|uniref:PTPRK n=1 Tax=Mytilus coruscus TaxID=42192 RepID=A0A6J8B9S2_MYTCO|nr:PTPRK [Mytilus coruscus]